MNTVSNKSASFLENMLTLKNFFGRNDHTAFLFAVCDSYHVRKEVNELVKSYCEDKKIQIGTVELIPNVSDGFLTQLRKAKEQYNRGLILTNIDTLINDTNGVFAYDLNHMREGLIALKIPILIWLNRQNHTIITQKAIDLYLRRDLSTLFFDDVVSPPKEGMIERFTESTREAADFEETQMRISLLEQQLEETKDDDLHQNRIANEIVLPLIKAYVQNSMLIPAKELLREYEGDFDYKKGEAYKVIAGLFKETGNLDKAIEYLNKAIKLNVELFGEYNNEVAYLYNEIGAIYNDNGNIEKAIDFLEMAVNLDLKLSLKESKNTSAAYNNLGLAWQDKGVLEKAIVYFEKALAIDQKISGQENLDKAIYYNNLGMAWCDKGDHKKAIEYLEKAVKIELKLSSKESVNVATIYNNLGLAWKNMGSLEKAIEYFERALNIERKQLGEENVKVTVRYHNLGKTWQEIGDFEKAIEYLHKAYAITSKLCGEAHPKTIATKKNYDLCLAEKAKQNRNEP